MASLDALTLTVSLTDDVGSLGTLASWVVACDHFLKVNVVYSSGHSCEGVG